MSMNNGIALHLPIVLPANSLNRMHVFSVYEAVLAENEVMCYEIAEGVEEQFGPLDETFWDISNTLVSIYDKLTKYYDILDELSFKGYALEDVIVYNTGVILIFEVAEL